MTSFWGTLLRVALVSVLLMTLAGRAGLAAETPTLQNEPGSAQEKSTAAKEDDRLPIYKEGWQFFLAPYMWIPGAHLSLSHQGRFSGTTVANVPCVALAFFVIMLMTPLTALSPQIVPAGPRITSIRSTSSSRTSCTSQ